MKINLKSKEVQAFVETLFPDYKGNIYANSLNYWAGYDIHINREYSNIEYNYNQLKQMSEFFETDNIECATFYESGSCSCCGGNLEVAFFIRETEVDKLKRLEVMGV